MRVVRTIQYILLEILAIFPFLLWVNSLLLSNLFQTWNWAYIVFLYLFAALFGRAVTNSSIRLLVGAVISLGLALLLAVNVSWHIFVLFVFFFALVLRGFQYSQEHLQDVYPLNLIWTISLPSYFISYILYSGESAANQQQLLSVLALILIFFLLFLTNKDHLKRASLLKSGQKQINDKMKYQNNLSVCLFFVFILALTKYNFISSAILLFFRGIFSLLSLFSGGEDTSVEIEKVEQEIPDFMMPLEPSPWSEIIDLILMIIGRAIVIVVLLIALYLVIKKIPLFAAKCKMLIQKISSFFLDIRKGQSFDDINGYHDEAESTFDFSERINQFANKIKSHLIRRKQWSTLTDQEKVRQLFREVIEEAVKQGYPFHHYETASEALERLDNEALQNHKLAEWLMSAYNQARYSNLTVEQIEELRTELEHNDWIS